MMCRIEVTSNITATGNNWYCGDGGEREAQRQSEKRLCVPAVETNREVEALADVPGLESDGRRLESHGVRALPVARSTLRRPASPR